jgi:lipoprotein-anchoring transpeptidase ErfK/SrfK
MKRPVFQLMCAVLLALCTVLGVVSPTSAAPVPIAPAQQEAASNGQSARVAVGNGSTSSNTAASAGSGERWIEVILSQRRLLAHQGNKIVLSSLVSIGKPRTPTIRGTFRIYSKVKSTRMRGPGYNLPNVPNVMYFRGGYAIHGAYWAKYFGGQISHGCVNMNLKDAAWLFNWAPVGTRVVIR